MKASVLSVSQKRLRELAQRSLRIIERHKGLDVSTAGLSETFVPAAQAYMEVYDAAVKSDVNMAGAMVRGRESIAELNQRFRACLILVRRALPELDLDQIDGGLDRPDRLIANATQIIDVLVAAGDKVRQAEGSIEALRKALAKAEEQWGAAQLARIELQTAQAAARASALTFQRELVALRAVLRHFLGSSHHDYQMLRSSHVRNDDTDGEETVEDISPAIQNGVSNSVNGTSNGASNGIGLHA